MTIEEIEKRKSEIAAEMDNEGADLDALTEEVRSLNAQAEEIKVAAEKRDALRKAVASGKGQTVKEMRKDTPDEAEIRNSKAYIEAYAEYVKNGDDTECRTLLTTNATNGTVAVPDFVYDIVKTAWEKNDIMTLVRKVELDGNLKINFERSATGAVLHEEGDEAVDEETLLLGIITIIPQYFKKWIGISKQAYSLRGEAFLRYIYDEIYNKIVKAGADALIGEIADLPTEATATSVSADQVAMAPGLNTVAQAFAHLSDAADNPVIVMNKLTFAAFEAARAQGNYAFDPYMKLSVHFSSTLPAYDTAEAGDVYMIVGDFAEGALVNLPNGNAVEFTFDPYSKKKENIIEILGEQYIGIGVVGDHAFTNVTKPGNP